MDRRWATGAPMPGTDAEPTRRTRRVRYAVPGLTDETVEVVEDDSVDDAMGEVSEQLAELGTQDHPVDGSVGLDDLPLFEAEVSFSR